MSPHPIETLKELSPQEQLFGGKFLRAILSKHRTNIENLDTPKLSIIAKLIDSFDIPTLKIFIIQSLNDSLHEKLLLMLSEASLLIYFQNWPDPTPLPDIFKHVPHNIQQKLLNALFHTDRHRYIHLKAFTTQNPTYTQGIRIEAASTTKNQLEAETESLLNLLTNPKTPPNTLLTKAQSIDNQYDISELETLYIKVTHNFKRLNLEIKNPETFTIYLNILTILNDRLTLFPILKQAIHPIIDKLLYTTANITDLNWQLTILSQLPHHCLQLAIQQLKQYEIIPEFKKRQLYGTLKETLEKELSNPKATTLLAAWEEV